MDKVDEVEAGIPRSLILNSLQEYKVDRVDTGVGKLDWLTSALTVSVQAHILKSAGASSVRYVSDLL